ncbi:mCG1028685, partial [Mus musculus]
WQATPVKRCLNLQNHRTMKDEIYCIKMIFKGRVKTQEIVLRTKKYPGMKANTCNPSTWKANGGGA